MIAGVAGLSLWAENLDRMLTFHHDGNILQLLQLP